MTARGNVYLISGESGTISSRGSALPPRTWRPSMSLCSPCRGTSSAQRERSRGSRTTRCWSCCTRRPSTTCSLPATPARSQTTSCWAESRLITKANGMEFWSSAWELQARLEIGPYDMAVHTPAFFRQNLVSFSPHLLFLYLHFNFQSRFLPEHAVRKTGSILSWLPWSASAKTSPEVGATLIVLYY